MGLFSFIKNAGAKVFGIGKTTEEEVAEVAVENSKKLFSTVNSLGFDVVDLDVEVKDDTVIVWGEADSQATKEKVILVLGNTTGIASVDDRMTVKIQEPEAQFYTVVGGDSLSKIAKSFYGNAMKYPVIFEANKPMLENPDKIYPGQVLRIPPIEE